jgi:hypothetical protein
MDRIESPAARGEKFSCAPDFVEKTARRTMTAAMALAVSCKNFAVELLNPMHAKFAILAVFLQKETSWILTGGSVRL